MQVATMTVTSSGTFKSSVTVSHLAAQSGNFTAYFTVDSTANFKSSVTASHFDSQSANFTRSMTASTASVYGNAFSVGGSSFVVTNSSAGIGTSSPGSLLHVIGDGTFTRGVTASSFTSTGDIRLSTGVLTMGTASSIRWASGATGQILAKDGAATLPSYSFASDPTTGIRSPTGGYMEFHGAGNLASIQMESSNVTFGVTGSNAYNIKARSFGTIAAPGISTDNDSDTGLSFLQGNTLHIISGGVSALNLSAGGGVTTSSSHTIQGVVFSSGASAGIRVSSGTTITNIFKSSFTFDFPNVPATGGISFGFATTNNSGGGAVAAGDVCWVEAPALEDDLSISFASATTTNNVLAIRFENLGLVGVDPALQLYRYGCMRSAP